jgi:limonene-1,2-epoxide hydrolase
MTRYQVVTFASEWAAAWNERACERVVGYFREDCTFTSPTALAVVGIATVRGKDALRAYWDKALAGIGSLRFAIDRVIWDATTRELAIIYVSDVDGRIKRMSENLVFAPDGLVVSAEVFHGVSG